MFCDVGVGRTSRSIYVNLKVNELKALYDAGYSHFVTVNVML